MFIDTENNKEGKFKKLSQAVVWSTICNQLWYLVVFSQFCNASGHENQSMVKYTKKYKKYLSEIIVHQIFVITVFKYLKNVIES